MILEIFYIFLGLVVVFFVHWLIDLFRLLNYLGIDFIIVANSRNPVDRCINMALDKTVEKAHLLSIRGERLLRRAHQEDLFVCQFTQRLRTMADETSISRDGRRLVFSLNISMPENDTHIKKIFDSETDRTTWRLYLRELREFGSYTHKVADLFKR